MPGSGGAPLSKEIIEFFDAVGIRIAEGYGLTECTTAASTNRPDVYRFGSVGQPLPGVEIRIAQDGEIEMRSETVFQGYYKDPEATAAVLGSDGWLKTGDIGTLDEDGFLHITDRKKDILVTAGGKNVAPQNLENDLKTSKYVSQALVVGDRRALEVPGRLADGLGRAVEAGIDAIVIERPGRRLHGVVVPLEVYRVIQRHHAVEVRVRVPIDVIRKPRVRTKAHGGIGELVRRPGDECHDRGAESEPGLRGRRPYRRHAEAA